MLEVSECYCIYILFWPVQETCPDAVPLRNINISMACKMVCKEYFSLDVFQDLKYRSLQFSINVHVFIGKQVLKITINFARLLHPGLQTSPSIKWWIEKFHLRWIRTCNFWVSSWKFYHCIIAPPLGYCPARIQQSILSNKTVELQQSTGHSVQLISIFGFVQQGPAVRQETVCDQKLEGLPYGAAVG